jgi:ABC-type transport system substrate-binding protein
VRRAANRCWLLVTLVLVLAACTNTLPPQARPPAPAPPPPVAPASPEQGKQLVVAVDDLGTGFNPHLNSDASALSTDVAALVLPSVFRPDASGALALDTTVATSAKVTSTAPFTVSYELNLAASWSDNAPIAAEDFVYLWQHMRTEPGVVDNAGYRLITDVRSRAGGKAVDVTFAQAYPAWPGLFGGLLPAHLLKDSPRSWATALSDNIPVSGGPFQVTSLDRARGQLVLARNDHYWGTPTVLDTLVLRRLDPTGLLDGLRTGELAVAHLWPDQATLTSLTQLAGQGDPVRLQPVAQPIVVELEMRTDQGVMTDQRVRQAVGALLDRSALIAVGTANGVGGVPDDAQLRAPSEPGYHPTAPQGAPTHPDPNTAAALLTSAGYLRDAQGHWTLLGTPLQVTVGAPTDRPRFLAIATEVVRQLTAAGVAAQVVTAPGSSLAAEPTVVPTPPSTTPGLTTSPNPVPGPGPGVPGPGPGGHGVPGPGALAQAPVHGASAPAAGAAPAPAVPTPAVPPPAPPAPAAATTAPAGATTAPGAPAAPGASAPSSTSSSSPPGTAAAPAPTGVLVDLTVMARAVGGDPASSAVSSYGCPPGMAGVSQPARNPTGFCFAALQPLLDATLGGALSLDQAGATIESILWQQLPAIPLFQPVTTLVSTPKGDQATGQLAPGPLTVGPLATAPRWHPLSG